MKKLLALISSSILVLSLAGCFGGGGDDMDYEEEAMDEAVEGVVEVERAKSVTYNPVISYATAFEDGYANYTVTLDTVIDHWYYPEESPAATISPSEGMKNILVGVTVAAASENEANAMVLMNDFSLHLGEESYSPVWFLAQSGREDFPSSLDVAAGESVAKDLLFEVPEDTPVLEVDLKIASAELVE